MKTHAATPKTDFHFRVANTDVTWGQIEKRAKRWRIAFYVCLIVACMGWYGTYATYGNGYDQGRKDGGSDSYAAGKAEGDKVARALMASDNQQSVDTIVRAKLQEKEQEINTRLIQERSQAYQQGQSDYARRVVEMQMAQQRAVLVPKK